MSESNIAHLPAEYRSEFSVNDQGQAFATKRAVARLAGVSHVSVSRVFQEIKFGSNEYSKLAQMIIDNGFQDVDLIPYELAVLIIGYYAMDANRYCTEQAKHSYKCLTGRNVLSAPKKGIRKLRVSKSEENVQKKLKAEIGGESEVETPSGRIDLLTDNEIIEIKGAKNWKSAIGQVIAYGQYYPNHKKIIYLFNKTSSQDENIILQTCQPLSISVIWQGQDFYKTLNSGKDSENKVIAKKTEKIPTKKQKKEIKENKDVIQLSLF